MAKSVNKLTPMEKLTKGYENFIKGKELNKIDKRAFDKVVKKIATKKQRGSK